MVNLCPDALLDDGLLDFTLLFGSLHEQVRAGRLQLPHAYHVHSTRSPCQ
jgi:hypothetical protein